MEENNIILIYPETYKSKYKIGDVVFLITDVDQCQRIITGVLFRPNGVVYYVGFGSTETVHYEMEIAPNKNYSI